MAKKMNPIDRIIKEKLEGFSVPFDPDAWQLMQQKLEEDGMGIAGEGQPAADTRNVDEAIFEKLHRYEAPYRPGHWQRMEAILEGTSSWPRQVIRCKLIELALMLLLFLFLWQYLPLRPTTRAVSPQAYENTPAPSLPLEEKAIIGEGAIHKEPAASESSPIAGPSGRRDGASAGIVASTRAGQLSGGDSGNAAAAGASPASDGGFRGLAAKAPEDGGSRRLLLSLAPVVRQPLLLNVPRHNLPAMGIFQAGPSPLCVPERLETLPAELVYQGLPDVGNATFVKNKGRSAFRVGMFGSAEYNHITVPSSQEKRLEEELQRYAMGYGGGLSAGFELGRFEVETGAIYAARQYPVGLVYVNGNIRDGLEGQRLRASALNILNIPLHFRYNFLHWRSWRAYALMGASLQVAFQRNYYVTGEPRYDYRPSQPPPPPPPPAPAAGDEPAIELIRRSGLGWFEGGTFEENAYLTGNVGVGLERYINSRWSLFAQPTYQHSLQYFRVGLGPNADQINSLSILFGAKVRLK